VSPVDFPEKMRRIQQDNRKGGPAITAHGLLDLKQEIYSQTGKALIVDWNSRQ
jgi:hypothetical protein